RPSGRSGSCARKPCRSCRSSSRHRCSQAKQKSPTRTMATNPDPGLEAAAPAAVLPDAPAAARRLPLAFAKRNGVLIEDADARPMTAIYRKGASMLSLAEVRRFAGAPIRFVEVDAETFDQHLQAAYESGAARTMVEGFDDD